MFEYEVDDHVLVVRGDGGDEAVMVFHCELQAVAQLAETLHGARPIEVRLDDEPLTARERAVLERIAAGDSNKLIARALDISPHTVKRHVANILDKLGLSSRGQASAWLRERG